jgi:RNA polymerase sigma-70 factor (ECF subfamily)
MGHTDDPAARIAPEAGRFPAAGGANPSGLFGRIRHVVRCRRCPAGWDGGPGDADAAAAFVARFQRRVFGLAITIVGDPRTAEDVAQEALLRAWRHGAAYDARRGSVATWLLAIARNLAIDAMRVRRPRVIDPDVLLGMALSDDRAGPPEMTIARDDAYELRLALRDLPEEQRRAIVLAGIAGLSAREVAEAECIPLGTAKTRIRTAMQRLRAALVPSERSE